MSICIHDASKVWQTASEVCRDDKCCDRCEALRANRGNGVASAAEAKLAQAKDCGEKQCCNFELHLSSLTKELQALKSTLGHRGWAKSNESRKVQHLSAGIKNKKRSAPRAQIMSSHALQDSFDDSVRLHRDFIAQQR